MAKQATYIHAMEIAIQNQTSVKFKSQYHRGHSDHHLLAA
jgi:hypothetical protein